MARVLPIVILSLLLLQGCSNENTSEQLFDRMCGEWEFTGTEIKEEWKKSSDLSYHVDVISYEGWEPEKVQTIDISIKGDSINYEGEILRNHNTTRPIRFKAIEVDSDQVLFKNDAQEFPQHIRYTLVHDDQVRVKISGSQNGKYREQEFVYYRVGSAYSSPL